MAHIAARGAAYIVILGMYIPQALSAPVPTHAINQDDPDSVRDGRLGIGYGDDHGRVCISSDNVPEAWLSRVIRPRDSRPIARPMSARRSRRRERAGTDCLLAPQ